MNRRLVICGVVVCCACQSRAAVVANAVDRLATSTLSAWTESGTGRSGIMLNGGGAPLTYTRSYPSLANVAFQVEAVDDAVTPYVNAGVGDIAGTTTLDPGNAAANPLHFDFDGLGDDRTVTGWLVAEDACGRSRACTTTSCVIPDRVSPDATAPGGGGCAAGAGASVLPLVMALSAVLCRKGRRSVRSRR